MGVGIYTHRGWRQRLFYKETNCQGFVACILSPGGLSTARRNFIPISYLIKTIFERG